MGRQQHPFSALIPYLPEGSFEPVLHYIQQYKVQLTITRSRQSILGDYRHAWGPKGHRISVNGTLNPYSFLITLLHELAHLFTYERHKHHVAAHGREWKNEFGNILAEFVQKKIFPPDIESTLLQSLKNPAASSCADIKLMRVLRQYDVKKEGHFLVEQLPEGAIFTIKGGTLFKKGPKIRTRYKCMEIKTGRIFLFSAVYEVKLKQ